MTLVSINNAILAPLEGVMQLGGVDVVIYAPNETPDNAMDRDTVYITVDISYPASLVLAINPRALTRDEGQLFFQLKTVKNSGYANILKVVDALRELYEGNTTNYGQAKFQSGAVNSITADDAYIYTYRARFVVNRAL